MSQVEALSGVAPYARYAVASEEVEPAIGWAYAHFLGGLADDPEQDGARSPRASSNPISTRTCGSRTMPPAPTT